MADVSEAHMFAEPDYMYGRGPLALRIEHVDHSSPARYNGDLWLQVGGVQIGHGGTEIGHRSALVRARQLPATLRHRGNNRTAEQDRQPTAFSRSSDAVPEGWCSAAAPPGRTGPTGACPDR